MFGWFRTAAPARETGVAMVDPRGGNSLLVIGTAHPRLAATCAAVTGLNGRAVIVGRGAIEQKLVVDPAGESLVNAFGKRGLIKAVVLGEDSAFARMPPDERAVNETDFGVPLHLFQL